MVKMQGTTELVHLEEEILVQGLGLQKSGLPICFESLGKLWERYGARCRGRVESAVAPVVEVAVSLNQVPDYITGCVVTSPDKVSGGDTSFILPKGAYIKDTFCAPSFEELVGETLQGRDVSGWAKEHHVTIDKSFSVEVYPAGVRDASPAEMYTLTPIKE